MQSLMSRLVQPLSLTRRHALQGLALGAMTTLARGAFAEELVATPQLTEGPFYPTKLPLDTDNDLLIINDSITPAVGQITHLTGRVLSAAGEPVAGAFVEIWQVDGNGVYLHSGSDQASQRDAHFQGYGRFLTDRKGRYYFRTVKPVPYPGRPAPHVHFAISLNGHRIYTTQLFVNNFPGNLRDGIYRSIEDPLALATVAVDFVPIPDSKLGELSARFDIVMGVTPADRDPAKIQGGIGPAQFSRETMFQAPGRRS
jgi:protocatechuate 3,4-dioxygenase beta subunit